MWRCILAISLSVMWLGAGCSDDSPINGNGPQPVSDTIHVPADMPDIQMAIDTAADGQLVLVAPGTYIGSGNRDIDFRGKRIGVRSADGPATTILDLQGSADTNHTGFVFFSGETPESELDGFTIRGGYGPNGAGIGMLNSSPTIRNCIFVANTAYASGGVIHCKSSSPTIESCTFSDNAAPVGSAVFCIAGSSPRLENCLLAFAGEGEAVYCSDQINNPVLICCDVYGNAGGDWADCIAGQADSVGNLSADPAFCHRGSGDYHLQPGSPCAATNNSCGSLIGALDVHCTRSSVAPPH